VGFFHRAAVMHRMRQRQSLKRLKSSQLSDVALQLLYDARGHDDE
jgi:hypothetical protein